MKSNRHLAPTAATHLSIKLAIVSNSYEGWKPKLSSGPFFFAMTLAVLFIKHISLHINSMCLHKTASCTWSRWELLDPWRAFSTRGHFTERFHFQQYNLYLFLAAVAFLKEIVWHFRKHPCSFPCKALDGKVDMTKCKYGLPAMKLFYHHISVRLFWWKHKC